MFLLVDDVKELIIMVMEIFEVKLSFVIEVLVILVVLIVNSEIVE